MTPEAIAAELHALLTHAAIFPLDDRAFLRITGSDATRWLNGMVTNSIQALAPGQGNYNFLLNAQGRIQGDCTIYREPGDEPTFLLETDEVQIETIRQLLDKFIIMDDVELSRDLQLFGTTVSGLAILGPHALALMQKVFDFDEEDDASVVPITDFGRMGYANLPSEKRFRLPDDFNEGAAIVFTHPVSAVPRFDIWLRGTDARERARKLLEVAGAIDLSNSAQEALRILEARPKFGIDIRDKDLPQETNQTHALHFAKGCYLGQEIVERIRSRGQVHRTFTAFTLTGSIPTLPTPLTLDGKPAGELTSAIQIGPDILALGYARREALLESHPLTYEGGTAIIRPVKTQHQ